MYRMGTFSMLLRSSASSRDAFDFVLNTPLILSTDDWSETNREGAARERTTKSHAV